MRSLEWMHDAACQDQPGFTLLPADDAREICLTCPVIRACSDWAFTAQAQGVPGVLGGLTLDQRGQVDCEQCEDTVWKKDTRNGLCWRCYKAAKVAV